MRKPTVKIGDIELKDGTIFRDERGKKYRANFFEVGYNYNIDVWDYESGKLFTAMGTIKQTGGVELSNMLLHIDKIL